MKSLVYIGLLLSSTAQAYTFNSLNLVSGKKVQFDSSQKTNITVFLSEDCPCTQSHMEHIKDLALQFKEFSFVAIQSGPMKKAKNHKSYYQTLNLPFPVFTDPDFKWANHFKASKTPHAFINTPQGKTLYQGGVSNSVKIKTATRFYLKEALIQLKNKQTITTPRTRTLGCVIDRG